MPHRHGSLLSTAASGQATKLRREVAVLLARGGLSGLDEGHTQPGVALAGLATQAFASALFITGAHAGPRGEMGSAREAAQVGADLSQQYFGGAASDPRDAIQTVDLVLKRLQPVGYLLTQPSDRLIQEIDVRQLLGHEEALMGSEATSQGTLELR